MMLGGTRFKREGFPGQRLHVVPRSIVRAALAAPLTSQLVVTDCGYFPHAAGHGRIRPNGAGQTIVIVCAAGGGWVELDGVRHTLGPRQAVIIPKRVPHAYGADATDPWTIWWLHLEGAALPAILEACDASTERPLLAVPAITKASALVDEALDELEQDETLPSLIAASGAAWHLLTVLASAPGLTHDTTVDRIKQVLAEDLAGALTAADVAARVNLSTSHLTAVFKARTGMPPMQYRTLRRMQRARMLLDTTDRPIAAIARETGYPDVAYFSRRFHELHEMSPRSYRRTGKG